MREQNKQSLTDRNKPFTSSDNKNIIRSGQHKKQGERKFDKFAESTEGTAKSKREKSGFKSRPTKVWTNTNATGKASSQHAEQLAIGDRIVVTIKRIGINGEGVGYYKRKTVFINGAITDEVVKAKITAIHPSFLQAQLIEIEKKSKHRQTPPCAVYDICGGCQLQHMTYDAQLIAKADIVAEAFMRYAKIDVKQLQPKPTLGMEHPWHYRNKAQLQVGRHKQQLITGLYAAGTHELIDISECLVQDEAINNVYKQLKPILERYQVEPYQEKSNRGQLKTIVIRIAKHTNHLQLTFVTATSDALPHEQQLINEIVTQIPKITSISQNIHPKRSSIIFGDTTNLLWGEPYIEEQLGELKFSLSARAFFQLNPVQVVNLYDLAKQAAQLTGKETVVDAYCGTGTIGLWLAPAAKEVRGIEVIAEAVEDANRNAEKSGISNAKFYVGKAEQLLPQWLKQGFKPDVVVVDPPRTGLDNSLIEALLQVKPQRIVYVSCNPSTLAKDCAHLLANKQYRLGWVQPVDMFAQTSSVEVVTVLEKI